MGQSFGSSKAAQILILEICGKMMSLVSKVPVSVFSRSTMFAPAATRLLGITARNPTNFSKNLNNFSRCSSTSLLKGNLSQEAKEKPDVYHFASGHLPQYVGKYQEIELAEESHLLHPVWTQEELDAVLMTHTPPQGVVEKAALMAVRTLRYLFDLGSGYKYGKRDERCYVTRVLFLETIAGVPGMIGAMIRHLRSLRKMERDYGWIHTLLEEAENERMHLITALTISDPSFFVRTFVLAAQLGFVTFYTLSYVISPRFCHRMVGYLEEQAVVTYTDLVNKCDAGLLPKFMSPAHAAAVQYWQLQPNASWRDVFQSMRADEYHHQIVNHTLADMTRSDVNPFPPGF